jgi:SpoVK/Ycf46/Vps4 family AAA+-type ATPase
MFLTSNRCAAIDPAFQSRIDSIISFKDLDAAARKQIWKHLLDSIDSYSAIDEDGLDQLASLPVNGREVKNLLKNAHMISRYQQTYITARTLTDLATMRQEAQNAVQNP